MNVSARSALISGMALATAGVVAIAPTVSPVVPDLVRASEFVAMPVRANEVALTGAIVDLITNATVGFINLYYPIRNAGQVAIDVANAIVYNPYIQVWPITAWMSQINAAWTLGTGILDDTPPGAGTVQLLVDAVKIPQAVLNGSPLRAELSHLADLSLNALNYSAAYLLNYGFYQLAYFTFIWIRPITPPLFPLVPASVEFKLPGLFNRNFLRTNVDAQATLRDSGPAGIPASVKAALAPVRTAADRVKGEVGGVKEHPTSALRAQRESSLTKLGARPNLAADIASSAAKVDTTKHRAQAGKNLRQVAGHPPRLARHAVTPRSALRSHR